MYIYLFEKNYVLDQVRECNKFLLLKVVINFLLVVYTFLDLEDHLWLKCPNNFGVERSNIKWHQWLIIASICILDGRISIISTCVWSLSSYLHFRLIHHLQRECEILKEPKQNSSFMTMIGGIFWFCFSHLLMTCVSFCCL